MTTSSNSLCRERDAPSSGRRSTSHHVRYRAVPRKNRTLTTVNTHNHSSTSSTTESPVCVPSLPWQCFCADASPGECTDVSSPAGCALLARILLQLQSVLSEDFPRRVSQPTTYRQREAFGRDSTKWRMWRCRKRPPSCYNLAFGNIMVHSENGRFVVTITAARSARPAMIWNSRLRP
jgi:hypothetical protein